jgi:hypothetical protein
MGGGQGRAGSTPALAALAPLGLAREGVGQWECFCRDVVGCPDWPDPVGRWLEGGLSFVRRPQASAGFGAGLALVGPGWPWVSCRARGQIDERQDQLRGSRDVRSG